MVNPPARAVSAQFYTHDVCENLFLRLAECDRENHRRRVSVECAAVLTRGVPMAADVPSHVRDRHLVRPVQHLVLLRAQTSRWSSVPSLTCSLRGGLVDIVESSVASDPRRAFRSTSGRALPRL